MDDLMTDYDVIVVGTGMTESILASALSRIGKSVLHMDSNEYYGENWASFNFEGIQNWIKKNMSHKEVHCEIVNNEGLKENERVFKITPRINVSNVKEKWYCDMDVDRLAEDVSAASVEDKENDLKEGGDVIPEKKETVVESSEQLIRKESRRFNLDLCPKVLFSRGPLVELLISSNIAKYAEFKSVSRVLTWRNECLELVPCSRADVFSTKNITVVEKRLLVKILTLFLKYPENSDELIGFENKPFIEYLKHKKLPNNIIHYILYAMAMGDKNTPCLEGVKASKSFLESLGRYGNTPFIFSMYGSGELPQCFCRLCAVFGGVYYLKRGVEGVIVEGDKCVGIMSENKRLNAKTVILSSNHIPLDLVTKKDTIKVSRGIFITDRSILKSEKEPLTLLLFPPVPQVSENSVTVIELGPGTNTCPDKTFVVHMTASTTSDADTDLKHVADALFHSEGGEDCEKPKVLWSLTWNVTQEVSITTKVENLKICSGPNTELDFKFSIDEAKRLFKEICPDEEFLPRAPDPDEIVMQGEESEESAEKTTEQSESVNETTSQELDNTADSVESAEKTTEQSENVNQTVEAPSQKPDNHENTAEN